MGNKIVNISLESSDNFLSAGEEILPFTDVNKPPHFSSTLPSLFNGNKFLISSIRSTIYFWNHKWGKIIHEENSIEVMEEEGKKSSKEMSEKKSTIFLFLLKRLAKEPSTLDRKTWKCFKMTFKILTFMSSSSISLQNEFQSGSSQVLACSSEATKVFAANEAKRLNNEKSHKRIKFRIAANSIS